jgi:CHRD domain
MTLPASRRLAIGITVLAGLAWAGIAHAAPVSFTVELTGAQEVPAVASPATGTAEITFDPATRALTWSLSYKDLSSAATMAHFHGPAAAGANGPVAVWVSKQGGGGAESPIRGEATLSAAQAKEFEAGQWYVNVHSKDHPAGEIRGQVKPPNG